MATPAAAGAPAPIRQPIPAPLTRAAIFLVVTVNPAPTDARRCGRYAPISPRCCARSGFATSKAVSPASWGSAPRPGTGCSASRGRRSCIRSARFRAGARHAVATPGRHAVPHPRRAHGSVLRTGDADHDAARRMPFRRSTRCTAFAISTAATCLGFVDGTENPTGQEAVDATLIGDEDPAFAGGSYVIVQKYLHDLAGWNALPTEAQERIIGRTKLSDIELDDAVKPSSAHNALTMIVENGREIKILRDNMPFGQAGQGRVRHLFHRLQPLAAHHRADAGKHVHRPAARQLRPHARFQPRRHRQSVLRAVRDVSRRGDADAPPAAAGARPPAADASATHPAGARWFARHRLAQRKTPHEQSAPRACPDLRRGLGADRGRGLAHAEALSRRAARRRCAGPERRRAVRRRHRPSAEYRGAGRRHPRPPARGEGAGRIARAVRARPPDDRRRRARRQRFGLAAGQGRRQKDRLCRGRRDLRRLCRGRHPGHPPGHQQPDRDPSRPTCATIPTRSPMR